jgi:hypothetical protein
VNDSINNIETKKSFNELQTQYETSKKEKEILLLNERDKKKQFFIYSGAIVLILLFVLLFTLYNRFRLKRRSAQELALRNAEIQNKNNLIETKQTEILDSIHYAKRIQTALLANEHYINKQLNRLNPSSKSDS